MIFCIDPGHHKSVSGKRFPNRPPYVIIEWEFAMSVSVKIVELLNNTEHHAFLTMHPDDVKNKSLAQRRNIALRGPANALISIHANAAGNGIKWEDKASGRILFHNSKGEPLAAFLADSFGRNMPSIGPRKRGELALSRPGERKGIVEIKQIPAVLVEAGFMTHPKEAYILASEYGQNQIAQSVFNGCLRWAAHKVNSNA